MLSSLLTVLIDVARQADLEAELQECERSIKIFSHTVFIDPRGNLTNSQPTESDDYGQDRWERKLQ